MKLLNLIKKRATTRNYTKKIVSKKKINIILDAASWGPSLGGFQVGIFVVIRNKKIKDKINDILKKRLKRLGVVGRAVFVPSTMSSLETCSILIAIYTSGKFEGLISSFAKYTTKNKKNNIFVKLAQQAEISAVSASIQNMTLIIEEMGLGSCWLNIPLFCEAEIKKLLKIDNKLVAFLAVGNFTKKEKRATRLSIDQTRRFL